MALFKVQSFYMKAITMIAVTAMLMASVMGEDSLNDFSGGVYDSGNAVFSGGKGLAITSNGLLVKVGILTLTPKGCYSSCGDVSYGNGEIVTKSKFLYYGNKGTKVQDGNYYSGTAGSTYIYDSGSE
jgi:hypothetical protein